MKDRVPANPGRVLITPENGSAPFYATMARADNPTQEGDPLDKNTLLKDATAAKFGFGDTAVPDDVFSAIKTFLDSNKEYALDKACKAVGKNGGNDYSSRIPATSISGGWGTPNASTETATLTIQFDLSSLADNVRLCFVDGFVINKGNGTGQTSSAKCDITAVININGVDVDFGYVKKEAYGVINHTSLVIGPDYSSACFNIAAVYGRALTKQDTLSLKVTFKDVTSNASYYGYYSVTSASGNFRCLEV